MNVLSALFVWTLAVSCVVLGLYQGLVLAEVFSTPPLIEGILGGVLPVFFGMASIPLCSMSYNYLLARSR